MRVEEDSNGVTCQGEGEGGRERDVTQTTPASRHVKTRLLATEISGEDENIGLLPESSLLCCGEEWRWWWCCLGEAGQTRLIHEGWGKELQVGRSRKKNHED